MQKRRVLLCLLSAFLLGNGECQDRPQYPYSSAPAAARFVNGGNFAYPLDYRSTLVIAYEPNCLTLHYLTNEGEAKPAVFPTNNSVRDTVIAGSAYRFPEILNFHRLPAAE